MYVHGIRALFPFPGDVLKKVTMAADIVFDKFHLIANDHAVIDEVRRAEWRKANAEDKAVVKGQRYHLFRSPWRRTAKQTRDLMALLHINEDLAYLLLKLRQESLDFVPSS